MIDTQSDYEKRRDTCGTADHFLSRATRVWKAAEDKCGLPEPMQFHNGVMERLRRRLEFVEVLTPDLIIKLADLARDGKLRDGFLLVNANMPAEKFAAERERALKDAGLPTHRTKPTAFEQDQWTGALFLYLHELNRETPHNLARDFLADDPKAFGRNGKERHKLTQRVRDGIDSAWAELLRQKSLP